MRIAPLFLALPLLGAAPAPTDRHHRAGELPLRAGGDPASPWPALCAAPRQPLGAAGTISSPLHFLAAAGAGPGKIEVAVGASADVAIVAPAAGRYEVKCTHFTHAMRGMKGEIIVE